MSFIPFFIFNNSFFLIQKNTAEMEQKELEARLKEMQDKVMGGHENIIDETKKQEAILRKTAADLEKKAVCPPSLPPSSLPFLLI